MNRLILIGNGFDLAHGMKTSYRDFILDYLKNVFKQAKQNGAYEDDLVLVKVNPNIYEYANPGLDFDNWPIANFAKYIDGPTFQTRNFFNEYVTAHKYEFIFQNKSELIKILIKKCDDYNWVDVENEYYLLLCKLSSENKLDKISELNEQFKYLQQLLQDYLRKIEKKFVDDDCDSFFKSYLVDKLTEIANLPEEQIRALGKHTSKLKPAKILILNFNYTITISDYLDSIQKIIPETKIMNIHGKIDDEENPIIFGYGDEEETNYATLEKYDECLRFVKTYRYSRTHNYQNFIDFVNSDTFEVYVAGHSCGLSDKTLLSEVFNNKNCYKLKLLTYNKKGDSIIKIESTDYIEKTYQIGRVFKEKSEMRRKLIPFNVADLLTIRKKP
ncbi:MAG: hypothetical protein J0L47_07210 [Flavobacteriales bacterium]|nr:hypothetical protein [Flavobacteriales bacterium]MCA0391560.1 bacteriophage abortive infection AbiH family protein [Bacteroidota bacterium]